MLEHPRHAAQPPSPGGQRSAGGSWKQRTTRGKEQLSRWLTIYKGETKRSTKAILEDDTEECRQLRTLASGCQCKHHAALSLKRTVWVKKTTRKKDGIPRTTKPSLCARDECPKKIGHLTEKPFFVRRRLFFVLQSCSKSSWGRFAQTVVFVPWTR